MMKISYQTENIIENKIDDNKNEKDEINIDDINKNNSEEDIPEEQVFINIAAFGSNIITEEHTDYKQIYEGMREYILNSDISIITQEATLGNKTSYDKNSNTLTNNYKLADNLLDMGIDIVSQATNHSYDKGYDGVKNTTNYYDKIGMKHTGFASSDKTEDKFTFYEVEGKTIAFVSYTYGLNGNNLPKDAAYLVNTLYDSKKVIEDLAYAKANADVVIVLPHWGDGAGDTANTYQIQWATLFAENGADVIIGSHPDSIQEVDVLLNTKGKEVPCYFSLGNIGDNGAKVSMVALINIALYVDKVEISANSQIIK